MKAYSLLVMALLVMAVVPSVLATSVGSGIGIDITTEEFAPRIWMCDDRVVTDNEGQPGRITGEGKNMVERIHNYAFEGEKIHWDVLVMDKNKIEQVTDVVGTIGSDQGEGNDVEVECIRQVEGSKEIPKSCNARILEEELTVFNDDTMAYYDCTLTVETPASMHGEFFITVEAIDATGLSSTMDENEFWFLNPEISLSIDGDLEFDNVRPGTQAYSDTLLVGNDAEDGSGVILDMFISGTNFYDPDSSGARCPVTNELNLDAIRYFATNGAYSTIGDDEVSGADFADIRDVDAEGYVNIHNTMEAFSTKFYNDAEIIQNGALGGYYVANTLSPGSEMALTFKLTMPEPCVGDFSEGTINFWGEAI